MNTFVIIIVVCDGCFYGLFEKRIYDLCNHTHESYNEKRRGGCIIQKYTKLFTFFRWVWKRVNFIFTLFSSSTCLCYINSVSVKVKTWLVLRSCFNFVSVKNHIFQMIIKRMYPIKFRFLIFFYDITRNYLSE